MGIERDNSTDSVAFVVRRRERGILKCFDELGLSKCCRILNIQCGDGRVMSNFILQALRDEPVTIFGDGSQTRSFCFVSDMVDVLIGLMNREDFAGPVNLGSQEEKTIKELAEMIIDLTGGIYYD